MESEDNLHWKRPNLGIVDWSGSTDNNLIGADSFGSRGARPSPK